MNSFYNFEAEDARCELHKMEEYRGKVVFGREHGNTMRIHAAV